MTLKTPYKTIVVKVGTNVLTQDGDKLDLNVIQDLAEQVSEMRKSGIDVILVSSGAVGAGKSMYKLRNQVSIETRRQVYSAIGQIKLMSLYAEFFKEHDVNVCQVLATKDDFTGTEHYRNMKNCFEGLIKEEIVPIVNENDVVSLSELMFTDNDELAGLTSRMLKADALVILTSVDGLYNGDPNKLGTELISTVCVGTTDLREVEYVKNSNVGRGGMKSKVDVAMACAEKGIHTYIANGKQKLGLLKVLNGEKIGTHFVPESNSNVSI